MGGTRGATHIVRITLGFTPLHDVVAPPYTSKITKFYVESKGLFRDIRNARGGFKGFFLSVLHHYGKPVFKVVGSRRLVVLRRGATYTANISAMCREEHIESVLGLEAESLKTPYGAFLIEPLETSLTRLESLGRDLDAAFKINLITPTILSTKIMMPPTFKARRRVGNMYKLLPSASYIFAYLSKLWNTNVDPRLALPKPGSDELWAPYKVGRVADLILAEVNFDLKPITIPYDKRNGDFRKIRGVIGWIHYKVLHSKPMTVLSKLLALAEYMGLGKSRGIGMGEIRVSRATDKSPHVHENASS